jgi:hypothetical protein
VAVPDTSRDKYSVSHPKLQVVGNPWPVTLGQVAFGIAMEMAASLYVFAVKGWLR